MYSKNFLRSLYRTLYSIRHFETECIKLYRQGLIRGYFHPYLGEEGIASGVCAALADRDYITSTHRGHGHCIARGARFKGMVAELLGKKTGYNSGFGGSMHIAELEKGNLGANAIVGGNIAMGVGAALGVSIREEDRVVVIFTTDGASNNGAFSESLNLAAAWDLPAIIVIENNQYAVSTTIEEATRETELYKRGHGFGVESYRVDGNNPFEVYEKTKESVEKCRKGKGPILIEGVTFRHAGHHVNDPGTYMPEDKVKYYKEEKDPVKHVRQYMIDEAKIPEQEIETIEQKIETEMEEAVEFAQNSPEVSIEEFRELIEEY